MPYPITCVVGLIGTCIIFSSRFGRFLLNCRGGGEAWNVRRISPSMPPNAAANEDMGQGGVASIECSGHALGGAAAVKPVKSSQFNMADFRPVKHLGSGDTGSVFLVAQKTDKAPYAMKVMRKDVLHARKKKHRAKTERDILSSLNHPFLPALHSHFEDDKHMFLVISYCHGRDLNILRHEQPEQSFSESACRFYAAEVLLALEYLHRHNIVYRDLKPENILIQSDGHVMLTDFDLSLDLSARKWTKPAAHDVEESPSPSCQVKSEMRSSKASHMKAFLARGNPVALAKKLSKKAPAGSRVSPEELHARRKRSSELRNTVNGPAKSFVGTEEYIAPEIILGKGHGLAVDWWTLGILLFELFYGKTPFLGRNQKETFSNILSKPVIFPGPSSCLADLIHKLLAKEPEKRLGGKDGAEEIKKHPFFNGVNWDDLEYISRTPVLPEPFCWEKIEEDVRAKAKASGKELQTKWSFQCETTGSSIEERNNINTSITSGPSETNLSLKCSDSDFYFDGWVVKTLLQVDSASSPREHSSEDENCSEEACRLNSQSDGHKQLILVTPKEEVRLNDDALVDHKIFQDVF